MRLARVLQHIAPYPIAPALQGLCYCGEARVTSRALSIRPGAAAAQHPRASGRLARLPRYANTPPASRMTGPAGLGGELKGTVRPAPGGGACDEGAGSREGKGRGGRAAEGGATGQGRDVQISRALSRLLRHQAENAGVNLDGEGFAQLDKVVSA